MGKQKNRQVWKSHRRPSFPLASSHPCFLHTAHFLHFASTFISIKIIYGFIYTPAYPCRLQIQIIYSVILEKRLEKPSLITHSHVKIGYYSMQTTPEQAYRRDKDLLLLSPRKVWSSNSLYSLPWHGDSKLGIWDQTLHMGYN